jgi:hypothetical protein
MDSQLVHFLFPTGDREYRLTETVPEVGDWLTRGRDEWRVLGVQKDAEGNTLVTLAPTTPVEGRTGSDTVAIESNGAGG